MRIYEIIAKEMEKKPEERSFHFKQIQNYLKSLGYKADSLKNCGHPKDAVIMESKYLAGKEVKKEKVWFTSRFMEGGILFCKDYDLLKYLMSNRETLFSANTTYHNILISYYKHNYIEYLDLKNAIVDKMQKIFHNDMPFLYNNSACHEIEFQFSGWRATIGTAGETSCSKEYADEWNKFMQTKWGEEVLEMTKDDLKTGMVVETRDGNKYMVIRGEFNTTNYGEQSLMFIRPDGFNHNDVYADDLIHTKYKDFDVVKIYAPPMRGFKDTLNDERNLIWERKSTREVCLEKEIEHLKAQLKEAEVELEKERGK